MNIEKIISQMTLCEKVQLLTGGIGEMTTCGMEKFQIPARKMADGPHGIRGKAEQNCTHFPNLCALAASWNTVLSEKMGNHIAVDCIHHGVDMILGPGVNIKRTPLCGRNFEYFSEDPVLAGEMAAAYIKGVEEFGVATSLKHFAANNQEKYRERINVEVDERTLRELYLKPFEIAVKKGKPSSVMCAYNKINSVWCSENKFILDEILKQEWEYDGVVVSDWGAVHDIVKAVRAGLDLEMPRNEKSAEQLKAGVENGSITEEAIDCAVKRMLKLVEKKVRKEITYNRMKQHEAACEIAGEGIVLLKNDNKVLPLTGEKYQNILVVGEFAESPLISGQGSAEVLNDAAYTDKPLAELEKRLPNVRIQYAEGYRKAQLSDKMLWPYVDGEFISLLENQDIVVFFAGSMVSEDTEKFDRNTIFLNPNYQLFIDRAKENGKKVVVVLQSGSALAVGEWEKSADAIVEMWLGGEAAGSAIANVLTGIVNPSGKLPETFPRALRNDLEYPGDGIKIEYNEKLNVGYRYYDKHPEEVVFPFGHGLSYTEFSYSDLKIQKNTDSFTVSLKVKNIGDCTGKEVVQLYVSDEVSTVTKPVKELKKFEKIFLDKGEEKEVTFCMTKEDFSYYNTVLHEWVAENGVYKLLVGASSEDIRLEGRIFYEENMPYTIVQTGKDMIG